MFAFAIYAVAVWFAAARWRRTWLSFAAVLAGGLGLVAVAYLHYRLNIWTHGRIYLRVLQVMLYPYTAMVVGMGLYIACLPRAAGERAAVHCPACHYDLAGLEPEGLVCPECGMLYEYAVARQIRGIHAGMMGDPTPEPMPRVIPNPRRKALISRGGAATPSRPAGPGPGGPRWPAIGSPAAWRHSSDG